MIYFRWRSCTVGIEQYWHGILDHDGIGRRRYREIKAIGAEISALSDLIVGSENISSVALIKSFDNCWSHRGQPHNANFNYNALLDAYYTAVVKQHVNLDVTGVESDFSKYKLVMMPAFNLVTEEIAAKCEAYVENGGALILTFRSGTRTWNNQMTTLTVPGLFKQLAGVELEEFDSVNFGRTVRIQGAFGQGTASIWCDVLKTVGAKTIASYGNHYYAGEAAVTVNTYGTGRVYYVGCDLDQLALGSLMELIVKEEGVPTALTTPIDGIEAIEKVKNGQAYLMLLNHNNEHVECPLKGCYQDAMSGVKLQERIKIAPYGVQLLLKC